MKLLEIIREVQRHLQESGRLSYRMLRREFGLDDESLEELIEELVDIRRVAVREDKALAWSGTQAGEPGSRRAGSGLDEGSAGALRRSAKASPSQRDPRAYTPKHLADKILQSKSALEGERKQVTVLFADVKGSMELAEQLDPEQWHAILDRFFAILTDGVHRFEGTVNQYTGDGIMALFGAPIAHEDHAHRACYAALHLLDALRTYAREVKRTHSLDFAVRIGINSGAVVVGKIGDDLRMDYTAQGHTVGLAQRLESLADANACYLSTATAQLVGGFFELRDLGPFALKGVAEPVNVYELQGVGRLRTRLDVARARGFSKFVGRDHEIAMLEEAFTQAVAGHGQVLGVVADAGTGKSRLCFEFVERCRARSVMVNEAHCPPHGKTVPFLPVLEIMRGIFGIGERDSDHEARRKIAGELTLLDRKFNELLPLIFEFLNVADPLQPPPNMNPEARQRHLLAFVRHLVQARSAREPAVVFVDDLHWIDPGSDEFLAHAVEAAGGSRTLVLVNFRPEYHAAWMSKSYYRQLPLLPLGPEAVQELLHDLLGNDPSLAALPARIRERTGGNPFFTEEVVQSLIESGSLEGSKGAYRLTRPVDALEIPAKVHSVLAARIDRLAEREKQVLQTAAVIGKEFTEPILRSVVGAPLVGAGAASERAGTRPALTEDDLAASLGMLEQAEFVFQKALYPEAEYAFKHPLTQEVALGSQLATRQARTHARVAEAIEAADPDKLAERAALLAHHWEAAGDAAAAATWCARAARKAGVDSPVEALRCWRKVRQLLGEIPPTPESTALRLDTAAEILNFGWRQGLTDEERSAVLAEGEELAVQSGDVRKQVMLLALSTVSDYLGAAPARARRPAEEALALADRDGETELRWNVREGMGMTLFYLGVLEPALRRFDEGIAIAQAAPSTSPGFKGFSSGWLSGARAMPLIEMGRHAEAAEALRRSEDFLRRSNEVEMLSYTHSVWVWLLERTGDARAALAHARQALESAEKVGSSLPLGVAYFHHGAALSMNEDWEAAIVWLERALELARGARAWLVAEGRYLAWLAEAYLARGDAERARATATEAVEAARRRKTPVFECRAQLAVARVRLQDGDDRAATEADDALRRCLELVDATGARSYVPFVHEQRAALARRCGDEDTRLRELREAYRVFSEQGATGHAERISRELSAIDQRSAVSGQPRADAKRGRTKGGRKK